MYSPIVYNRLMCPKVFCEQFQYTTDQTTQTHQPHPTPHFTPTRSLLHPKCKRMDRFSVEVDLKCRQGLMANSLLVSIDLFLCHYADTHQLTNTRTFNKQYIYQLLTLA